MIVADGSRRKRLRSEFGTTFFVRAGAGTGKTNEVVARIVELVAAGALQIRELVAITFTEAAAAELRARIREGLSEAAHEDGRSNEARHRSLVAVQDIGDASIDTIHAFAGFLLRTYPLDAGLPLNFEMLDPIEQDSELDERFRAYFDALGTGPDRELARRALLLGLTPTHLSELARGLHDHYDLLTAGEPWTAAPVPRDAVTTAATLGGDLEQLAKLVKPAMSSEPIVKTVQGLSSAAERLRGVHEEEAALAALRLIERIDGKNDGSFQDWEARGLGGITLRRLKEGLKRVEYIADATLSTHRTATLTGVLGSLKRTVIAAAAERKRGGVATFHDLLTWSRDLLRDNADVRDRARSRWSRIFIDEFQDTDPLQAEIAFYLASEQGSTGHWQDLPLVPGKLCIVGDPKQSIYRFRRADIALYDAVGSKVGTSIELTQNFRSVPRVLEFVNEHYREHMIEMPGLQPPYGELVAEPEETDTGVWTFGGPLASSQPEVWTAEADAVAVSARRIVRDGWNVSDGKGAARRPRNARYSDIAILIPTRTNLRRLERSFEREDVPYRIESGELIVQTQEVRDLVATLRAIDDPSDEVAIVATLRSVAYGCSDVDLLQWSESGGRWSYEFPGAGTGDRVRSALEDLGALHLRRHRSTVSALIQELLDTRMLIAGAFAEPRPRESWRRYKYVLDRARAFSASRERTLRAFVDWMEGLQRDQFRDVSSALTEEDEDAVRVLTVHGSKGLEFPIVVLTGWGSRSPTRTAQVLADRVNDRIEVGIGPKDDGPRPWRTVGYDRAEAREQHLAEAENIRLSYVAMTRARDHLIISLFRREKEREAQATGFASTLERWGRADQIDLSPVPTAHVADSRDLAREDVEAHARVETDWVRARTELVAQLGGLRLLTATGLKDESVSAQPSAEQANPPRYPKGRGGTALGRAVHAVLQTVDLRTLDGLVTLADSQAAAEGIEHRARDVERLVRTACSTEVVRRVVASGRYWREVPVGAQVRGAVLEGFIDLLYEEDGDLVILDYKTDDIAPSEIDERLATYRTQGGVYALAARHALGRTIARVEFLFVSLGATRVLPDLSSAEQEVEQLIGSGV